MGEPRPGPGEAPGSHHQVLATGCLPDDLLQLLYVKQLSPSDAASSKQIKLPKNEVKAFLGDLRHKQRCMVVGGKQKPVAFLAKLWPAQLLTCLEVQPITVPSTYQTPLAL